MEPQNQVWLPPPAKPTLGDNEVHIWQAQLEPPPSALPKLRSILAPDELDKAARFYFDSDRQHYIVGRATLRLILSLYINVNPEHIHFHYNEYGKPRLAPEFDPHLLNFNLSHSGGVALYALTHNRAIGIDLERIRSDFTYTEIAERFFSPQENALLQTVPAEDKLQAFFNCWTRKEAFIKAHGQGLSLPLDSFDVSFAPGQPPALLNMRGSPQEPAHWTLHGLSPGPGYAAALAVKAQTSNFKYWQWPLPTPHTAAATRTACSSPPTASSS